MGPSGTGSLVGPIGPYMGPITFSDFIGPYGAYRALYRLLYFPSVVSPYLGPCIVFTNTQRVQKCNGGPAATMAAALAKDRDTHRECAERQRVDKAATG